MSRCTAGSAVSIDSMRTRAPGFKSDSVRGCSKIAQIRIVIIRYFGAELNRKDAAA